MATLDIKRGDVLVVGTKEYPVRAVEIWPWVGATPSFAKLATVAASTKRPPAISGGKRGAAVTQIASLNCLPLMPISADVQRRLVLDTPYQALQTFVEGDSFLLLVVEDLKK